MATYQEALEQAELMSANCPAGWRISIREPSIGHYYYADFVKPKSMMGFAELELNQLIGNEHAETCKHNPGNRSIKHHNIVLGFNKRSKR